MSKEERKATSATEAVSAHYSRQNIEQIILSELSKSGKDINNLTVDDLAPMDELHTRGREATANLAALAGFHKNQRVLDVGSGIGGPSRYIASKYGCKVVGLDLVSEHCTAAKALAKRVKLDDRVQYRQGDATNMPFEDKSFDVAWTQHASMNIQDKEKLYSEICRVLVTGGKLVIYDIFAGADGKVPVIYPVPWAKDESISFLIRQQDARNLLKNVGFSEILWQDTTAASIEWIKQMIKKVQQSGSSAGGGLLIRNAIVGPEWPRLIKNLAQNLEENRLAVAQGILELR
jgi:MPBQ/MSBQ methyltransferase